MNTSLLRNHVAILCVAIGLFSAGAARAQPATDRSKLPTSEGEQSEARERYARGVQLASEGKYQTALIEMQRAYALNPSYKILYNLGQIYSHLGDEASAQTNYERYLAEGGTDIPSPRVNEVTQEIAKLRPHVASVELTVKGEGAEVMVDDAVVGRSPFHKSILVNAGKHKFSAVRSGIEPVTRIIPLAGEDNIRLELEVVRSANTSATSHSSDNQSVAPASKVQRTTVDTSAQGDAASSSYVWVGWTVTAALGIGTGIAGLVAKNQADQLRDLRDTPMTTRQSLDDSQASTFRAALVTDILLGATAVAAGISLYYSLSPRSTEKSEASNPKLALSVGPAGVHLKQEF